MVIGFHNATLAEHNKVYAIASAEYAKTRAAARAEYDNACDAALAEYVKTRAAARAELDRVYGISVS